MLQIINHENGTIISGDEALLQRLPEGFDPTTVDLTDFRIDAHNLAIAYEYATYKGLEAIKFYSGLKAAYIKQQELAIASRRPVVVEEVEETEEETEEV